MTILLHTGGSITQDPSQERCSLQEFKQNSKLNVTEIDDFHSLHESVQVIGDWQNLCWNLRVEEDVMNRVKNDRDHPKEECLQSYFNSGHCSWEEVVIAVARPPFKNKRLAKKIVQKYIVHESNRNNILNWLAENCN